MSTPSEPTTTSYAILGLLALQPWTTYELARQMDRALGLFWPRARSKLYEEPKRLVALGLATATEEYVGRRRRTLYDITPAGRRALAAWITQPGGGPVVEYEQLVRVFFAEHGSKQDLLATIASAREWVEDRALQHEQIPHEYLEGQGGFPQRLPWLILTGKFLDELDLAVDRWSRWATEVVESWPDDLTRAEPDLATLRELAETASAFAERARRRQGQGG